jgi:hypothetical protein
MDGKLDGRDGGRKIKGVRVIPGGGWVGGTSDAWPSRSVKMTSNVRPSPRSTWPCMGGSEEGGEEGQSRGPKSDGDSRTGRVSE